MKGRAELTKTTLIGGLLVVLPIYLSVPAFIIEELADGRCTVLVPSVPTPAAGSLLILSRARVHPVDVPFAQVVTVSKWGTGAGGLARGYPYDIRMLEGFPQAEATARRRRPTRILLSARRRRDGRRG